MLAMAAARRAFFLLALFLWIVPALTALSRIVCSVLRISRAAFLSLAATAVLSFFSVIDM